MNVVKALNDVLRLVLELTLVAVAFSVGFQVGGNFLSHLAGGLLVAIAFCVLWGLFAAPKRRFATPPWVPGAMFVGFGALAVWALVAGGHQQLGVILGVLVVANEGARRSGLQFVNRVDERR